MLAAANTVPITRGHSRVRNLWYGEQLDDALSGSLESLDPAWVWVLEQDNSKVACLIAAPVCGTVLLLRLVATKDAPVWALPRILKKSLEVMKERGYKAYLVHLDLSKDAEAALAKIVLRARGKVMGQGVMFAGPTGRLGWDS